MIYAQTKDAQRICFFVAVLKDEPDSDLTHLAPVAGDVCVPLEDNHLLNDMFDDILLRENFAPLLLADEPPTDPFISYRDFQDPSPQLLSPNLSKVRNQNFLLY